MRAGETRDDKGGHPEGGKVKRVVPSSAGETVDDSERSGSGVKLQGRSKPGRGAGFARDEELAARRVLVGSAIKVVL